jgi:signal transduction histidine kinase
VQLGANMRRELFLIFKESVNNMVKHSGCTQAEIEFKIEGDHLSLMLHDNGQGFDVSRESEGHGLLSMRERTKGLGGEFAIVSGNGGGTTVTLEVPIGHGTIASHH